MEDLVGILSYPHLLEPPYSVTICNQFASSPFPASTMSTLAVPAWLQSLYEVNHLNRAYDVLAKRERARDSARSQSRRRSSSQTRKSTKLVNAVLPSALTGRSSDDEQEHYAVTAGCRPENINFNRYARLEAYDRTRVIVGEGGHAQLSRGDTPGRYINANWVRELNGGKWWIATQAPLPITLHAFLSVILQPISRPPANLHAMTYTTKTTRVRTVVQLTPNFEGGLQKGAMNSITISHNLTSSIRSTFIFPR
jgi:protein tyrosine phosphatase